LIIRYAKPINVYSIRYPADGAPIVSDLSPTGSVPLEDVYGKPIFSRARERDRDWRESPFDESLPVALYLFGRSREVRNIGLYLDDREGLVSAALDQDRFGKGVATGAAFAPAPENLKKAWITFVFLLSEQFAIRRAPDIPALRFQQLRQQVLRPDFGDSGCCGHAMLLTRFAIQAKVVEM
jgi:hypothetical protein